MLGHDKAQSNQENLFRITQQPLSPIKEVAVILVSKYATAYPILASLGAAMASDALFRFLFVFGGTILRIPAIPYTEEESRMSHLPDILERFGEIVHRDLVRHYHGQVLKIPPFERFRSSIRNSDIFCALDKCTTEESLQREATRTAKYYNMAVADVKAVWSRMQELKEPSLPEE